MWPFLQYSKAANHSKELEDCEQANKLGAVNSTLRYAVTYNSSIKILTKGHFFLSVLFLQCAGFCSSFFHSPLKSKCEMMQEHLKVKVLGRLFPFFKKKVYCDFIWNLTASRDEESLQMNVLFLHFTSINLLCSWWLCWIKEFCPALSLCYTDVPVCDHSVNQIRELVSYFCWQSYF